MRLIPVLLASTFFISPASAADDIATQIDKACLRHAVSLVARLKAEVVGELSQMQSDRALKLATESCEAYFMREFGQNPPVARADDQREAESEAGEKEETGDWFTDQVIRGGDTERKKGNERLKKKR